MSTVVDQQPTAPQGSSGAPARSRGSLLRAELHRFRARRFIQVLLAVAVLGWMATTVITLTQFGTPSAAELAAAQQEIDRAVAENETFRQECLADPNRPEEVPADEWCGPPTTAADYELRFFLSDPPYPFAENTPVGALAVAAAGAALAFVLGATWIGAEWSTRSLVSLLFWEPRRTRVMAAKVTVLVLAAAALGAGLQAAWLATSSILDAAAGDGRGVPGDFWAELLGTQARAVLLTVLAAAGGFGLANLVRNTGAALGIGFVYFAIVEAAVGALQPEWQPWLLTNNAAGLLLPGGHTVVLYQETIDAQGNLISDMEEILVTNLQGGLVLGAVAALAVGLGVLLFARRDLQ